MFVHEDERNLLGLLLPLLPVGALLLWKFWVSPYAPTGWYALAWVVLLAIATAMAEEWWPPLVASAVTLVLVPGAEFQGLQDSPNVGNFFVLAFFLGMAAILAMGVGGLWRFNATTRTLVAGTVLGLLFLVAPFVDSNYRHQAREVRGRLTYQPPVGRYSPEGFSFSFYNSRSQPARPVSVTIVNGRRTVCELSGPAMVAEFTAATYEGRWAQCQGDVGRRFFAVRAEYWYDGEPEPSLTVFNVRGSDHR